jgi:hypothetical protein
MAEPETAAQPRERSEFDLLLERTPRARTSPDTAPLVLDFSDGPVRARRKATAAEWIGLVLAVIAPPLGLVVTIVARIVVYRRHGWTTAVARAATVISIVLTVLLAAGAAVYAVVSENAAAEARVVAAAQPLCDGLAATPGVLELEAYGWPTEIAPIADTLAAMKLYQEHWQQLAAIAPASAKAGTTAIADQATILVTSVESTQVIDRTANLAAMTAVTDASGLPQYAAAYCG